jgi:hypothetical protein
MDTATFTAFKIPFSVAAQWPSPNYTNPERRTWLVPYSVTLQVFVTIVLLVRLWVRFTRQAGKIGPDDFLIAMSWVKSLRHPSNLQSTANSSKDGQCSGYGNCNPRCLLFFPPFPRVLLTETSAVVKSGLDRHVWDTDSTLHVHAAFVSAAIISFCLEHRIHFSCRRPGSSNSFFWSPHLSPRCPSSPSTTASSAVRKTAASCGSSTLASSSSPSTWSSGHSTSSSCVSQPDPPGSLWTPDTQTTHASSAAYPTL